MNPHSVHTLNKHKEGIYAIALDNLNIIYTMDESKKEILIVKILIANNSTDKLSCDKLRTKKWLEKMTEIIDIRGNKELIDCKDE